MFALPKTHTKISARRQIDIRGVRENILLLPGRQYRCVLEVSPINFELKSEAEQDTLIDTFESFLNGLPCPLQMLVRIRKLDMDAYLSDVAARQAAEAEEVYQTQLEHYRSFVQSLITHNHILSRRFYAVIPYRALDNDFAAAKEHLLLSTDLVCKGFARMSIQTRRLNSFEVLDLFHAFYNPQQAKRQPLSERVVQLLNSVYVKSEQS